MRSRSSGTKAPMPRRRARLLPKCSRLDWMRRMLSSATRAVTPRRGPPARARRDARAALASAAKKVEAVYTYPHQYHGTMEPMNATATYTADKCDVWCPTQNGETALAAVAEASGLPIAKCDVYKTLLGGGFGRRGKTDYIRQVISIAKQMPGTPVKLIWSREEDLTHDFYHPTTQCKLTGGLDANGN